MIDYDVVWSDWRDRVYKSMRDGFGDGLVDVGDMRDDVVVLSADLGGSLRVGEFAKKWPDRFFNVGVAEQNMVGVASGLASEGFRVFATSFGVFSPGRSWDQVRVSVCYSNARVVLVGSHGGIATGEDGATHQALEDIGITRVLPNMKVVAPCDHNEARKVVSVAVDADSPVYIRLVRPKSYDITKPDGVGFKFGKSRIYRRGSDCTVLSYGLQVGESLLASDELEKEGIDVEVVNVSSIKPLDKDLIMRSITKTGRVVVAEDHQVVGGLGSAVAELIAREGVGVRFGQVGVNDVFGESGDWRELYEKYGLDWVGIVRAVKSLV